MHPMVMILAGFGAGILTMTVLSFYKWALEIWNNGFR
jgi:hypothetical protein